MRTDTDARKKLKTIESELSAARGEAAVLRRDFEKAKAAFAQSPTNDPSAGVFKRAQKASEELAEAETKIKGLEEVQIGLLKMMGESQHSRRDQNGPRSGDHGGAWQALARQIDLGAGIVQAEQRLGDLIPKVPQAGLTVEGSGVPGPALQIPGVIPTAQDRRFLAPRLRTEQIDDFTLSLSDWKQTGSRSVSGEVERSPTDTSEKAQLSIAVEHEAVELKQLAIVVDDLPSKLVSAEGFAEWCEIELEYQLARSLDAHILSQITAASPPTGKEGEGKLEEIRNAVKAMRALGASPTLLACSPDYAAELDTLTAGVDKLPIFPLGAVGGSNPLFGLQPVEIPGIESVTLIDPALLGIDYLGYARLLLDPYSGMSRNTLRLRLEHEALFHVRSIEGAYVIEGEGE
jgi:hypothetical protein